MDETYTLILLETKLHLEPLGRAFGVELDPFYQGIPDQVIPIPAPQEVRVSVMNEFNPRSKPILAAHLLSENDQIGKIVIVDRFVVQCENPKIYSVGNVQDFCSAVGCTQLTDEQRRKVDSVLFKRANPMSMLLNMGVMSGVNIIVTPTIDQEFAEQAEQDSRNFRKRLRTPEDDEEDPCCVCLTKEKSIMLEPCQHQVLCDECAEKIMDNAKECPVCREPVTNLFRPLKI